MFRDNIHFLTSILLVVFLAQHACAEDLYIVDYLDGSITVIDSDDHPASGAGTPASKQHISGKKTGLSDHDEFDICVFNNELFVTNDDNGRDENALLVFNAAATGNVGPIRSITSLGSPRGVAVSGSELFVADYFKGDKGIKVFNINDSGPAVTPTRVIRNDNLGEVWNIVISGSELFISSGSKILVFNKSAGTTDGSKTNINRTIDGFTNAIGLAVDDEFLYVGSNAKITKFPLSADDSADSVAEISGVLAGLGTPWGLAVKNGYIYAADQSKAKIYAFKTTDNGNVAPQWSYENIPNCSSPLAISFAEGGYVRPSEHQQSGVNVSIVSNTENATTDTVLQSAYRTPSNFELRAPLGSFTATVDSNGANGVFRFNSTSLSGTTNNVRLYKCFETNGTSIPFGSYSIAVDPDTEGTWWLEDDNGNYIDPGTPLAKGTNYWVNYVVKDNGIYDEDRTLGSIKDPAALGAVDLQGCVMNPAAGFGLEWLLLAFATVIGLIARK